jgi:U3 small nucleolar RNA-associated protein 19
MLISFLKRSYQVGGLIGVLSLDAVFYLMRTQNLEFPNFYDNLYAILDESCLRAVYRVKLFKFLRLFLSSTMVPAYVVAGIIKRLSRLSLAAPPSAIVWIVPFIYNVLHDYPAIRVMIHREDVIFEDGDLFIANEKDLSKCRALESSLWEINALEKHYWPRIAKLPVILREKYTRPVYSLDEIAEGINEVDTCMASGEELGHKWSQRPAISMDIPDRVF